MRRPRSRPYWLSGGTELCEPCAAPHVLEMHFRCVWCDSGCCAECVVLIRETGERLCPACAASARAGSRSPLPEPR